MPSRETVKTVIILFVKVVSVTVISLLYNFFVLILTN